MGSPSMIHTLARKLSPAHCPRSALASCAPSKHSHCKLTCKQRLPTSPHPRATLARGHVCGHAASLVPLGFEMWAGHGWALRVFHKGGAHPLEVGNAIAVDNLEQPVLAKEKTRLGRDCPRLRGRGLLHLERTIHSATTR